MLLHSVLRIWKAFFSSGGPVSNCASTPLNQNPESIQHQMLLYKAKATSLDWDRHKWPPPFKMQFFLCCTSATLYPKDTIQTSALGTVKQSRRAGVPPLCLSFRWAKCCRERLSNKNNSRNWTFWLILLCLKMSELQLKSNTKDRKGSEQWELEDMITLS